jgi:O-acetyl-ADP-ribose deacetylase (regulator of RNase III)
MRSVLILTLAVLALSAGCAANDQAKVSSAAVTPLNDLNLVNAPVPETLLRAQRDPYGAPAQASCAGLLAEVHGLDADLGPDLDAPASEANPGLVERGGGAVAGALQKTAEGVVPFRGWVRKLSGAERYSRKVAAAIAAGTVRRAYLKGIASGKGC